jgi:hypothetical protein
MGEPEIFKAAYVKKSTGFANIKIMLFGAYLTICEIEFFNYKTFNFLI